MNLLLGLVLLAAGVAMVRCATPTPAGVGPAFMRNGLARELWPVACLAVLVPGAAVLVDAVVDLVGLSAGTALFPR